MEVHKTIQKRGAQKLKSASQLQGKFRSARDTAGQNVHKRAPKGFHSAETIAHIKEEDRLPRKVRKLLVGSALSSPIVTAKLIYYIPAGTIYTLVHPSNAWKTVNEKVPAILEEMKDPKFSGRIAGGLAGDGLTQLAYRDVPVACTLFLSSGFLTLGGITASKTREFKACAMRRSMPTHLQSERKQLDEKILKYDPVSVLYGFKEGVLPGAMGAVFAHTTLGGVFTENTRKFQENPPTLPLIFLALQIFSKLSSKATKNRNISFLELIIRQGNGYF
ncbi:MAG: hypothetical protein ACI9YB_003430 [Halioglobus sp.]|jgi:hypothetical protein